MATTKRTPKQVAATKKMQAAAKRARSAKKAPASHAKRSGSRTMAAAKAPQVVVVRQSDPAAAKPAPKAKRNYKAAAKATAGKAMKLGKELLDDVAIPAAIGAGAASAIDVAYGASRKWLPEKVANSPAKHAIKAGLGVVGAVVAQKAGLKPKHAKAAAVGVVTVALHRLLNEQVEQHVKLELNGVAVTMGDVAAVLPDEELNGLEALGAMAAGDAELGAVLPYFTRQAA